MTDVLGLAPGIRLTLPPVIGNHIAADRPEFAYLATRPPTADEAAAYLHRYDYPEWKQWPALAEAGIAFESRPLPSPLQAPSLPQCSCARCTDGPDEPAEGQGAPARSEKLPALPGDECPGCGGPRSERWYRGGAAGQPVTCTDDWHDDDAPEPGRHGIGELDEKADKHMTTFLADHDAQDAREGTAVIPLAAQLTEALPAVGAEGRDCDE